MVIECDGCILYQESIMACRVVFSIIMAILAFFTAADFIHFCKNRKWFDAAICGTLSAVFLWFAVYGVS